MRKYLLRHAGDIDFLLAGEQGGFEAETSFDALELRFSPALLERVAAQVGRGFNVSRLLAVRLLDRDETGVERTSGLSGVQLKRVMDHIEASLPDPLTLELSAVAGVSNSHLRTSGQTL